MIRIVVPGPQVATNAAYRGGRGRYWMTKEGKEFVERVKACTVRAVKQRSSMPFPWFSGPVYVSIDFFFRSARNDVDGPIKLVLDALAPAVYSNDRQVETLVAAKFVDSKSPRTVIQIMELVG